MAKRRNDARPPATSATPATQGGKRWVDLGGDELNRWGRWDEGESANTQRAFESVCDPGFWRDIEKQGEECDRILRDHGLPRAAQHIRFDGNGNWWDVSAPEAPKGKLTAPGGMALGWDFAKEQAKPFSDAWYAAMIAGEIYMILLDKLANHEMQLRRVLQIGILSKEWEWRARYKPSILTGQGTRKTLSEHRDKANSTKKLFVDVRRAEVSRMMAETSLNGGALEKYLRRRLKEEGGIDASLRTIRRDLLELRGPTKKVGQTG